jgi:serine/threonine protein kinase
MLESKDFANLPDSEFSKDFNAIGTLAYGNFGNISLVQERDTKNTFAMKTVLPSRYADFYTLGDAEREAEMQERVLSENVVSIYKKFRNGDGDFVILTEYLPDGELADKILRKGGLADGMDVRETFKQIVKGVERCHERGVAHLDLQPHNIWVKDKEVKIGDFGYARRTSVKMRIAVARSTVGFMAPECLRAWVDRQRYSEPFLDATSASGIDLRSWLNPHNSQRLENLSATPADCDLRAIDVWALGVTLYVMYTGRLPWKIKIRKRRGARKFLERIDKKGFYSVMRPLPRDMDLDARQLIRFMLDPDPAKRYTIEQVANHQYLGGKGGKRFSTKARNVEEYNPFEFMEELGTGFQYLWDSIWWAGAAENEKDWHK